jgi:hypothetical protein
MIKLNYKLLFIIITVFSLNLSAHPGWGLVADSRGNIFFADIVNTTIWKYSANGDLSKLYTNKWTHQLNIDSDDNLYIEYEQYINGVHWSGLIMVSPDGSETNLIPLTNDHELFLSGNTTIDNQGNIYFANQNRIYKHEPGVGSIIYAGGGEGNTDGSGTSAGFKSIFTMNLCNDGNIYISDNGSIRKLTQNGKVTTIVSGLLIESPPDNPFPGDNNPSLNRIYSITRDDNGNLYSAYHGNKRVLKISISGEVEEIYKSSDYWFPIGLLSHEEELVVLEVWHNSNSNNGLRLIKYSEDGKHKVLTQTNNDITNLEDNDMGAVHEGIKLYNSYPSPFNNSTKIKFEIFDSNIHRSVHLHLDIYNTLGEKIKTLFHGTKTPGVYEFDLASSELVSGVYYYQLSTRGFNETRKMIVLK